MDIEQQLKLIDREITEIKNVLGIRYKGDTGIVTDVEDLKNDRISARYERRQANALLYTSVFLHVLEVIMIIGLLMQL